MALPSGTTLYRSAATALVRATLHQPVPMPPWPDADVTPAAWCSWAGQVWANEPLARAVGHASPVLARQVRGLVSGEVTALRQARRICRALARYVRRAEGRATPFGLFAGVASAAFADSPAVVWGEENKSWARADAAWLSDVVQHLETLPGLLRLLPVRVTDTAFVRGSRLVVPYPPQTGRAGRNAAEVSLRYTVPVRVAVEAAREPVRGNVLVEKILAERPDVPVEKAVGLLTDLVRRGVLLTSLHAPLSVFDALDHLVTELLSAGADRREETAEVTARLRSVRNLLHEHNRAPDDAQADLRDRLREAMLRESTVVEQPVVVDSRLGCSVLLHQQVAREAEKAATVLARLSPYPAGAPAWNAYHSQFFERYGIGALVPLSDLVNPDVGLGFPAGFLGSGPERSEALSARDQRLLSLAQTAAIDGREEVELTEDLITALENDAPERRRTPSHLELKFQIQARSLHALAQGDFRLWDVSPSRGAGTLTGRFLDLLEPDARTQAHDVLTTLPVSDPGTRSAQISFTPMSRASTHVLRAPDVLPDVISIGEHRPAHGREIPLDDLAVGCDPHRLYLVSLSRKCRLNPVTFNALEMRTHTPPLVRFLAEISRSSTCVVAPFSWGAAEHLPFLPRIRHGRVVLAPARWRLTRSDLPGADAPASEWRGALADWRTRRRVPATVALVEQDRALPLDLTQAADAELLRVHLAAATAVLTEMPRAGGWFDGHAHEVVVPMTATATRPWPSLPPVAGHRLVKRDHGHVPGTSQWLMAKLYGHVERQPELLAWHVPELLAHFDTPPPWWYTRYRDPHSHLRLRLRLTNAADFGEAAARVGEWVLGLRRLGLVSDFQLATSYPETGRWGHGRALEAADDVFCADSRSLSAVFSLMARPHPQALTAANFVSVTTAFTGTVTEGMGWLIAHARLPDTRPLDRAVRAEALRLADPTDNWAALRSAPGGEAVHRSWAARDAALRTYRSELRATVGANPDQVLDSLLHVHHIRAAGIDKADERTCLTLARAAALAWKARRP